MTIYTHWVSSVLFPLHERLKRHSSVRMRRSLEVSQWWPLERIEALQTERLKQLFCYVSTQVPFYRDWFHSQSVPPPDRSTPLNLRQWPVIDKALIRAQGDQWLCEDATGLSVQRTSGSSGEPLVFYMGKERQSMDIAAKWRATRWWGVDVGDREIVLWGSAVETGAQDRVRTWRDRLMRSRLIPTQDLHPQRIDRIIDEIQAFRPRMLFGYPSALARVAWRAREQRRALDNLGMRVVFTTSEVLRPEWRQVISTVMGCPVANEYGARDAGFIARECPNGRLHITAEALIVEILDDQDQPVAPGEVGEIVVTNLMGPEFPFIRYRTGDRGALDLDPCPCGRSLPVLRELQGRANDGLVALDGAWVHGSAFNYLMRDLPELRAYKVIQQTRTQVDLLLSIQAALPPGFADRVEQAFVDRLGQGVKVSLQILDQIPTEANGKYRHVVCRVPSPTEASSA
ncbi:MAG: AMP-binding protein [Lamprobacter sp.]|uniref:phenylacetate--CoA ligase family protein n=1 Tax=Lamprobacter sp. TaxID=3100796 RepID=UPI002B2627F9|nr:AMP-binding protein [Lamprobacter sp.]MEA3642017.1 AMP-binding protein [Lamprobacter sp.]